MNTNYQNTNFPRQRFVLQQLFKRFHAYCNRERNIGRDYIRYKNKDSQKQKKTFLILKQESFKSEIETCVNGLTGFHNFWPFETSKNVMITMCGKRVDCDQ